MPQGLSGLKGPGHHVFGLSSRGFVAVFISQLSNCRLLVKGANVVFGKSWASSIPIRYLHISILDHRKGAPFVHIKDL